MAPGAIKATGDADRAAMDWRLLSQRHLSAGEERILGFTMVGAEAGEVLTVVQIATQANANYKVLWDAVIAHPTMPEGLNVLFSTVKEPMWTRVQLVSLPGTFGCEARS